MTLLKGVEPLREGLIMEVDGHKARWTTLANFCFLSYVCDALCKCGLTLSTTLPWYEQHLVLIRSWEYDNMMLLNSQNYDTFFYHLFFFYNSLLKDSANFIPKTA